MKDYLTNRIFHRTCLALMLFTISSSISAVELIIGEERVSPGIVFIFEGAVKDHIAPAEHHLSEGQTDVHIEARVNWDTQNIPKGAVPEGFVPYLDIVAEVKNEKTGAITFVDLSPHINLIDNFHYARNMALPGKKDDSYQVTFTIIPPNGKALGFHKDWINAHSNQLITKHTFTYQKVDFNEIANATR